MTPEEIELYTAEAKRQQRAREIGPLTSSLPAIPAAPSGVDIKAALDRLKTLPPRIRPDGVDTAAEQSRRQRISELRSKWGAPERHVAFLASQRPRGGEWCDTRAKIAQRLNSGFLVALLGTRGAGKTQMAVALMHDQTERMRSARYTTAMAFFLRIKSTFKATSKLSEEDVVNEMHRPALLVIDEIQERAESPWEDRILTSLIDTRYNDQKDTLLIGNITPETFKASFGLSVVRRLAETGGIVECKWEIKK